MSGFADGVVRWNVRVTGYALTLATDRCPPFPAGHLKTRTA